MDACSTFVNSWIKKLTITAPANSSIVDPLVFLKNDVVLFEVDVAFLLYNLSNRVYINIKLFDVVFPAF